MKTPRLSLMLAGFAQLPAAALAEEVTLPAPVLEWSFYILLIFAVCVAIGISIFMRGKEIPGKNLGSLLDRQNPVIHSVRPGDSVTDCVRRMNELNIGAMLVIENEQLLGIFTERDAMTRVLGEGLDPGATRMQNVMSKDPVSVSTLTTFEEAMNIITQRRIRHLPVVEDGKVLGLVSSGDLTHHLVRRSPSFPVE
jgi:CBS domain-containing protein